MRQIVMIGSAFGGLLIAGPAGLGAQTPDSIQVADSMAAAAGPAWNTRVLRSWTADRRAFVEGDILTVFVDERTLAAATAEDVARDNRSIGGSLSGDPIDRYAARIDRDFGSDERGRARRDEAFRTEISVLVTEVRPNGVLVVEGRKRFHVDDHNQDVVLRGMVRSADVSGPNIVEGWRIANLELLYESNGALIKPERGLLGRLLGIVF